MKKQGGGRRVIGIALFSIAWCMIPGIALSQSTAFAEKLSAPDSVANAFPREKIFIHHDKPYYIPGDTIWLKGYLMNAASHTPADSSGIVYMEIINEDHEVLKRTSSPVFFGLFSGSVALPQDDFPQGDYILRAYTRWMQNFGDSLFFESPFRIIDARSEQWKAVIKRIGFQNGRLELHTTLNSGNGQPLSATQATIRLRSGLRNYLRLRTRTNLAGNIYLDTTLSTVPADKKLVLEIRSGDNLQLSIPVKNSDTPRIDLQFLPEGGHLVAGILQRIGFKAIDISGKGVAVSGTIQDNNGNLVTSFQSVHKGMGLTSFIPQAGKTYSAVLANGAVYDLPEVEVSGTVFQIVNPQDADSITVNIITAQNDPAAVYYFAGRSRGITYAAGRVTLTHRQAEVRLARTMFPQGVVIFTLYGSDMRPLNDRSVFVWHGEAIRLSAEVHKERLGQQDSITVKIKARLTDTIPVQGSFSMAVMDTARVKFDADAENILSYMLLSSDLKGDIEDPWYYIKNPYSEASDALMLTQGWVRYDWKMPQPAFEKEREFRVSGKVSNAFNKPQANVNVTLLAKLGHDGTLLMDTVTDNRGAFVFHDFPYFFTDSVAMVLRALNKRNKAFNVGITLDAKPYPPYTREISRSWQDNLLFDTVSTTHVLNEQQQMVKDGYLEEVVIRARLKVQGSKNLNEDGGSDQVITEEILEKTPKESLLQVLAKQIPGFPTLRGMPFTIGKSKVEIVMDGMHLGWFEMDPIDVLQYYSAEDIRAIEVMKSLRYNMAYQSEFYDPMKIDFMDPPVFIEITTKTGEGLFMKKTPGIYLYKPLAPVIAKEFYSPGYSGSDEGKYFNDLRSTVYWNPNIITGNNGDAEVSFFTPNHKGSYLVVLQGTDLNGRFGVLFRY